jgi:hypothetical protein
MRYPTLAGLFVSALLLAPGVARAQGRPRVEFGSEDIQIGFPTGAEAGEAVDEKGRLSLYKAGFWTPVNVYFKAGPEPITAGYVAVEGTDSDDVQNSYTVPLPPSGVPANEPFRVLTYTKLGSAGGELRVTVNADGKSYEVRKGYDAIGPGDILYLTLGSRLPSLRQSIAAPPANPNVMGSRTRTTYVDQDVHTLPDRWFGYSGVDLVLLTTGRVEFVRALRQERDHRKEALMEWVRRGGRLVISCGRNQQEVPDLLGGLQIELPVEVTGLLPLQSLDSLQAWLPPGTPPLSNPIDKKRPGAPPAPVEVARLLRKPGREVETVVPAREGDPSPPLIVRAPFGMGQVMLVAFDLDQPPFMSWAGQGKFWERLQDKTRTKPADPNQPNTPQYRYGTGDSTNDLAAALERNLENFQDIPVISFGWVALFILIYIVIVGPLDYLFLKKVVKRLELTWITFPTVVLLVSAGAYYAAYSLKGNDLKVNKLDLVDIDFQTGRSYGHTWFTVFSPRIQLYTVGVEPAYPEGPEDRTPAATVVSWMGRPEGGYGGYNRAHSQSLFRRTYDYAPDAAGLAGVPIQVWSTKSFTASWDRPFHTDKSRRPFEADLRRHEGFVGLEGSVVNHLPTPLQDVVLIHGEGQSGSNIKVYVLGTLVPGQTKRLNASLPVQDLSKWLWDAAPGGSVVNPGVGAVPSFSSTGLMKRVMFFDASPQQDGVRDNALRDLDQSWRRVHPNEAMLVGRAAPLDGQAETVTQDPSTPSRLWLGRLPAAGGPRPPLAGTMTQDTYVRLILPVLPAAAPEKP